MDDSEPTNDANSKERFLWDGSGLRKLDSAWNDLGPLDDDVGDGVFEEVLRELDEIGRKRRAEQEPE
jgi:hypothetical protein